MTEAEKNEIVGLIMNQISSQAVDFDIETEQPQANDLLTAVRQTSSGAYVGVTIKWDDVARIATEVANRAAKRAEQAETDANNILERVQSKGTEITNFVATSKTEIETQKNKSVNAVKSVYQIDLNELKGDLANKLPKSPVNWEQWTAEEQATARERIGLGKFELLEESVFGETVNYMSRNKDNQGNNYCLDAILIYLETNADESNGIGRCAVYSDDGYLCDFYLSILNNTKGSLTTIRINAINGYWESIARNSINDHSTSSNYANIMNKSIKPVIKTGYIRSFYISGKIVAGSKLMIWGVRA